MANVTCEQLTVLMDFMEDHRELAFGKLSRSTEGRSLCKELWAECAQRLNAVSSKNRKNPDQWRLYYNEYKSKLLRKIRAGKTSVASGNGNAVQITLTPLQGRLYSLLGKDFGDPPPESHNNSVSNENEVEVEVLDEEDMQQNDISSLATMCTPSMSPHNWTNEEICQLIDLFKERDVLWNIQSEDYKNMYKKYQAWYEIATAFNIDRYAIERKVRSLIQQFQAELRKLKSGDGEGTSNWFAFNKMLFLKDCTNLEKSDGEPLLTEKLEERETEIEISQLYEDHAEREIKFNIPLATSYHKRKLQDTQENPESSEWKRRRDDCDIFGEYVATKLKQVNNNYARNTAQYHINNILYKVSIGEYDIPN